CLLEEGSVEIAGDCDDTDQNIHPEAIEICDDIDNNCDGNIDEDVTQTFYIDGDGDGFGDPNNNQTQCDQPDGYIIDDNDCNDLDVSLLEISNDMDCDSVLAEDDCDDNNDYNDCDDDNPNVGGLEYDFDCDGVVAVDDCNDEDETNTKNKQTDADCDGYLTANDCDDSNG
ncbi:MAG: putative metal-binding motif-containing protein, partial [Myxococcota bacterium]|nr:putative metal-binding motif-containing protein [Myxococcota bacterium]